MRLVVVLAAMALLAVPPGRASAQEAVTAAQSSDMQAPDAQSADGQTIELAVPGGAPVKLTGRDLARLPAIEQEVAFQTSQGLSRARYRGVLLWNVLEANHALATAGHHDELRQIFSVTGRDGYRIVFSVGEIAPDFGNRAMMIATEADGRPLAGPRLIVPGDRRGARSVRDVVGIEVR